MRHLWVATLTTCMLIPFAGCSYQANGWKKVGDLSIIKSDYRKAQEFSSKSIAAGHVIPAFPASVTDGAGMPFLFVDSSSTIHLKVVGEDVPPRYLRNHEWDYVSHYSIEQEMKGDWAGSEWEREEARRQSALDQFCPNAKEIQLALFRSITRSIDIDAMVKRFDAIYAGFSKDDPLNRGRMKYRDRDWESISRSDKEACVQKWIEGLCEEAGENRNISWVSEGDTLLGLLYLDDLPGFLSDYERPVEFRDVLEATGGTPEPFLRAVKNGKRVILIHTFTRRILFTTDQFMPDHRALFFAWKGCLFLANEDELWTMSPDGEVLNKRSIPIRPYAGVPTISPDYFVNDGWIYVLGQSRTNPKKADLWKADLSGLLRK